MEREVRYCRTPDGVTLAYGTLGAGPHVVMSASFLSGLGFPANANSQQAFDEAVARSFSLTRYDGRGMGLSDRQHNDYSLEARVHDLTAVADALRADRVSIIGTSYGAFAAVTFAARHPERVDRLVLWSAAARGASIYEDTDFGRLAHATRGVTVDQWEFISEALMARGAPPSVTRDEVAARAALFRETWTPHDLLAFREANRDIDVTGDLARIQAPTLVLFVPSAGASIEHSRLLAREIPDAQLFSGGYDGGAFDRRTMDRAIRFLGGDAHHHEPPSRAPASGVRTVLFTDLVGHTAMMQRLGDAQGRELLREHERITRETLRQHGGHEVKTMGDGFMASFGSVTSALECAIALQRAFSAVKLPSPLAGEGLGVRCGLNAGEPIEDEGDLFGATVILASRVAAQADAAEILIPEPVRHLLAGKGFVFADRGEFLPKGFEDAVRLFEVRWRE